MTHIRYAHLVWALLGLLVLNGCATLGLDPEITVNTPPSNTFQVDKKQESQKFASAEFIKTLSKEKQQQPDEQRHPLEGGRSGPGKVGEDDHQRQ